MNKIEDSPLTEKILSDIESLVEETFKEALTKYEEMLIRTVSNLSERLNKIEDRLGQLEQNQEEHQRYP